MIRGRSDCRGVEMKLPERITVDPQIMMGKPCVKGTRIPVYVLLQEMAAGIPA
jgi:uncharacterized protein (DUF433 family)